MPSGFEHEDDKLRRLVERILELKARRDANNAEIREVYAEVKAAGYDKSAIGKIVGFYRLPPDKRAELQSETIHQPVRSQGSARMPLKAWAAVPPEDFWTYLRPGDAAVVIPNGKGRH